MGAQSNTSTLLSTGSSTNKNRHFRSNGSSGNGRYTVGSVGKACGKHLKRPAPRHPNVAIATQVINPSAIGGTLKNRRFVEHFGPADRKDDEIGFLSHSRRSKCGKVCCYGLSIAVTVIMMTGLILAVGYMQSEKQKINSRPVKLAQGQILDQSDTFLTTSTTQPSTNLPKPATERPHLDNNQDDIDEIGLGDYADDESLQNLDSDSDQSNYIEDHTTTKPSTDTFLKESESEGSREGQEYESDDFDSNSQQDNDNVNIESHDSKHDEHDDSYSTAVKVLPPADFKFEGVSFEFPIYRSRLNQNNSTTKVMMNYASVEDEGTKELETSINDVNSNFTSLNDSAQEDNKVLSPSATSDEDYANAQPNSKPHENNNQPDSLSSSTHSYTDVSQNEANNFSEDLSKPGPIDDLGVANEQNQNNAFNFDSSNAKLETDIFDDEEDIDGDFEISASDQIKKGSETNEEKSEPPPPKQQHNRYRNRNHGNHRHEPKPPSFDVDKDDYHLEEERPRSDPRKLSLKKTYRKPQHSKGVEPDLFEKITEMPKHANDNHPPPISHTLPILEYKADFSNIQIPKSESNEVEPVKLQYQFPLPANVTGISDFKFDFTTPSPVTVNTDVKYDFKDFANTNTGVTKNEFSFPTYTSNPTVGSSATDFSLTQQVQTFTPDPIGNFVQQTSSTGLSHSASLTSAPQHQPDFNEFSKRTFFNYDIDPSTSGSVNSFANTNTNPFAHLLGPQSPTGVIGSASPTGATLNLFQPQPTSPYNFDSSSSNPSGPYSNLPPGTIPLDLTASHISVNTGAPYSSAGLSYSLTDPNGAYSVTSLNSDLPYPNIGLNTITSNNDQQQGNNAFSYPNYGLAGSYGSGNKDGVEILTTGQGQVPTYNTITQGMQLLNLLSGKTPQSQNPFSNNDQYSSASAYQPQQYEVSTQSQLQLPSLTGYGGSGNSFLQGLESSTISWKTPVEQNSVSSYGNHFQTYTPQPFENNYGIDPRNNYRGLESNDQLPAASTFRQSIVQKLASPNNGRSLKSVESSTQRPTTTETSVFRSLLSSGGNKPPKSTSSNNPRSLSVSILPNAVGSIATSLFENFIKPSKPLDQTDGLVPKSRKRDHPDPGNFPNSNKFKNFNSDLESSGSDIHIVTTDKPREFKYPLDHKSQNTELNKDRKVEDQMKNKSPVSGGIRSGFYV